jgi:hypothetical protein
MSHARTASAIAAFVLAASSTAALADGPFREVHVAASRSSYEGKCPVTIRYTANIRFALPHRGLVFNYHWERSDGAKGPVRVVHVSPGEKVMVLHESWRLGGRRQEHDAMETIYLNSGDPHEHRLSPAVHVACY